MTERRNRSDKYQYVLLEVNCTDEYLASFTNSDSLANRINPYQYDEKIDELEDELKKLFWEICDSQLTERQKVILHMRAEGKTQMEIADILGVNRSSITKSINGNVSYEKSGKNKVYGGAVKKLRKLMDKNPRIQEILTELSELRQERT